MALVAKVVRGARNYSSLLAWDVEALCCVPMGDRNEKGLFPQHPCRHSIHCLYLAKEFIFALKLSADG